MATVATSSNAGMGDDSTLVSSYGQGSTRAGRRARAKVLDRAGGMCEIRIPGICAGEASIADHIENIAALGILRRDATDPDLMQAACRPCHALKTRAEQRAGVDAHNQRRRRRKAKPHPGE